MRWGGGGGEGRGGEGRGSEGSDSAALKAESEAESRSPAAHETDCSRTDGRASGNGM